MDDTKSPTRESRRILLRRDLVVSDSPTQPALRLIDSHLLLQRAVVPQTETLQIQLVTQPYLPSRMQASPYIT